ncbi:hypothetical protein Tco_1146714 [Tanacetum coccineum]
MPSSYQKVALLQFERHYWCLQHALLPSYSNESRLRGERVPKVRNVIHKLLLPSFFQSYTWKIAIIHLWKVPEHCIAQKHATDMANVQFMPTLLRFTFFLTLPDGFIVLLLRNGIVSPSKMRTQDGVGVFESTLGRLMFGSSSSARKRILLLPFKQKILVPKRVEFGEAVEKIGLKILEWDCHSRSPKVKMVNGERQLQALFDKKKVIITDISIRIDLNLEDAGDTHYFSTITSKPQKKKSRRKERKDSAPTEPTAKDTPDEAHSRVLALETRKSNQALEIESLKRRVKSLEKRRKSRTSGFKRLRKVESASRVGSSNDASLGVTTRELTP